MLLKPIWVNGIQPGGLQQTLLRLTEYKFISLKF